ncbi:MAG: toll/interleukin-1 receptor domain-containing protein [Acidobacteriaceae bacterium]|nr:toll/interleukin-1 receptor domain-containing protein [Acidobacteriaceae bacterium]MBV9295367.1 toll/interleukin-1 receptor domain-containing protein [Acidobacteriaceae bacterium]MBV9763709.1 toll/interleukin-1 receptor domain-containing protein [Acidobacteriaceae bacterium]
MENIDQTRSLRALARRIHDGNCVLVLGPGASTDSVESREIPVHVKLAKKLAGELRLSKEDKKDLNSEDLRHVSQVLWALKRSSTLLQEEVIDFYRGYSGKTNEFHRNIAALPFRVCITTTPDDFLETALIQTGKKPMRDFYNFRSARITRMAEPTVDCPLVYHLYGHPDEPQSLVITENDLIDFLTKVISKAPPLPEGLIAKLSRSESTCLFIDVGFKNWYLRVLMRSLGLYEHSEMSFALEGSDFFAQSKQHQTIVYFSASKTPIDFHQDSLNLFVSNLRAAYEQIAEPSRQTVPEPPPGAPVVFLSYASEDREIVERLGLRLNAAGIAVWMDKQNLRAGDNWERILTQVIEKQVNYVVVIQTPAMLRRNEGVFYEEIDAALQRQKRMKEGLRFLIPVCAGDCSNLPTLESLHSISVTTDSGMNDLSRAILEDWNTRAPALATAS